MRKTTLLLLLPALLLGSLPVFAAAPDGDRDGVADGLDKCPFTLAGARIDPQGCALDADLDQVADGLDRCPNTSPGLTVDRNGCGAGQSASDAAPPPRRAAGPPVESKQEQIFNVLEQPPSELPPADAYVPVPLEPAPAPVAPAAPAAPIIIPPPPAPPAATGNDPSFYTLPSDPAPRFSSTPQPETPDYTPAPVLEDETFSDPLYTTVLFSANSSALSEYMIKKLGYSLPDLLKTVDRYPRVMIELAGHTDPKTDKKGDAVALSRARAETLKAFLVDKGLPAERVRVSAKGGDDPRFRTGDSGRNRRVEVLTYPK